MKKNVFSLNSLAILIAIIASAFVLPSCQSEAINEPNSVTENVKIFMSYSAPKQNGKMNAKSSSSEASSQAIVPGDTVDVNDLKNVNIILSAETDQGFKRDGFWTVTPMDLELNYVKNAYIANPPVYASEGSLIAIKLPMLGLYKATFKQKNGLAEISFFIRHTGIPGDIGDNFDNDYTFRLEKNVFQTYETTGNLLRHGYSLYLKSFEGEFDYVNDGKGPGDLHAMVFGENQEFITPAGFHISGCNMKLGRCKYSKDYLKLTFFSEDIPAIDGIYRVIFYAGTYGENWFVSESISKSNWNVGNEIVFKTF